MKIFLILSTIFISLVLNVKAQWTQSNFPSGIKTINCIAVTGNNIFVGTQNNGVFLSTDNGQSWSAINTGLPTNAWVKSLVISGNKIFVGLLFGGGVFSSTNNGSNWTATTLTDNLVIVNGFEVSGANIFAGGIGGVFLSTNNGTNWNKVLSANVISLGMSGTNIYAGTDSSKIFRSTNNGSNWTLVNYGLPTNAYQVSSIAINNNTIFASLYGLGIYLSTNNGANWVASNTGLVYPTLVNSIKISSSYIFAGNATVSISNNNGQSWATADNGLPSNGSITALYANTNYLYAGVFISATNNSIWKRSISNFSNGIENISTLNNTEIYPNPFSSYTILSCNKYFKNATLYIYDLSGKIVNKIFNISGQDILIERGNLICGIYYCKLIENNELISITKLIII